MGVVHVDDVVGFPSTGSTTIEDPDDGEMLGVLNQYQLS